MDQRRPPPPPPPQRSSSTSPVPPPPAPRKSIRLDASVLEQQMKALNTSGESSGAMSVSVSNSQQLISINEQVWIHDDAEVWARYTVVSYDQVGKTIIVSPTVKSGHQKEKVVPVGAVLKANSKVMPDMTSLHNIHEAGILDNLRQRSASQEAYTFMASALIAVNPLRRTAEPTFDSYVNKAVNTMAPHPYSIAESAYQNLCFSGKDQSIIIGGESGAGKTETAKIILKFLASRNQKDSDESILSTGSDSLDVKLLKSSPILESFGNAKTARNNNSSRFGKFMKLLFVADGGSGSSISGRGKSKPGSSNRILIGALVETYLLEKSRVISQSDEECNFHILYQLLKNVPKDCEELNLGSGNSQSFAILSNDNIRTFNTIQEMCDLSVISTALATLGLSTPQIHGIYRVLAGILHLGNVSFQSLDTAEGTIATISAADVSSVQALQYAATAFGIDSKALQVVITQREVVTRGETFIVSLTQQEASYTRDATIKVIYEALFESIVKYVNKSLLTSDSGVSGGGSGPNSSSAPPVPTKPAKPTKQSPNGVPTPNNASNKGNLFIGVLDIFGFENFAVNEYEQLLINYANEALQNTFNIQIFIKEIDLFKSENIDFSISSDDCPNNRVCVELISSKTNSVFSLLDSISRQPKPSDERFCEELHKAFSGKKGAVTNGTSYSDYFPSIHRKDMKSNFCIKHYAGEVKYTVDSINGPAAAAHGANAATSWIAKNNDSIPDGLQGLYLTSTLAEFKKLSGVEDISAEGSGSGKSAEMSSASGKRRTSVMMKPTIAAIFSKSMNELNTTLCDTSCHFIRCIKPNAHMTPGVFDNQYVVEQLRALGILQACEVLKVCLPTRVTYADLTAALGSIISKIAPLFANESQSMLIACILKAYNIPGDLYKLGRTMVFFKPGQLAQLEGILKGHSGDQGGVPSEAAIIQSIKDSLQESKKALDAVNKAETQFKELLDFFNAVEKKYEELLENSRNLPEIHSVELPEPLIQGVSFIDTSLKQLRTKHKELSALQVAVESDIAKLPSTAAMKRALQVQSANLKREIAQIESTITSTSTAFNTVNAQIAVLEDSVSNISGVFKDAIAANDVLYDEIQDQITECEEVSRTARDDAERCQLFSADAKAKECELLIQTTTNAIKTLDSGVALGNAELAKYEAGSSGVDFSAVMAQADELSATLTTSQSSVSTISTALNKLKLDVKTASTPIPTAPQPPTATVGAVKPSATDVPVPSPPPPPPLGSSPSVAAFAASGPYSADSPVPPQAPPKPEKRSSVAFGIKDLAAMRKKIAENSGADPSFSALSSVNGSAVTADAVRQIMQGKHASQLNAPATPVLAEKEKVKSDTALLNDDGLPVGWKEMVDKKSNRTYYVNTVTKERQWQKPGTTASPSTAGLTPPAKSRLDTTANTEAADNLPPLAQFWRAVVDKKTKRTYYVNDLTKERQWRRPEAPAKPAVVTEGSPTKVDRVSRRLNAADLAKVHSAVAAADGGVTDSASDCSSVAGFVRKGPSDPNARARKVATARRNSSILMDTETKVDFSEVSAITRHSVTYMNKIGGEGKKGYLMKQSKFLGRWKKRYVVLSESTLEYFDRPQDAQVPGNGKSFDLTGSSLTSYTSTENCICISSSNDSSDASSWFLLAENEQEMESWMTAINAHIHTRYCNTHNITTDFWDDGVVELSIWKVPEHTAQSGARRPVGIRSLPIADGPRTGEGIFPGEIVEIVQTIEDTHNNQRFLRLADDRGWVFENHPSGKYAIMTPVAGTLVEMPKKYHYSDDFLENLEIFNNPTCDPEQDIVKNVEFFKPGSDVFGCAEFTPTPESPDEVFTYIKLDDNHGWVSMHHPVTGGTLLQVVSVGNEARTSSAVDRSSPTVFGAKPKETIPVVKRVNPVAVALASNTTANTTVSSSMNVGTTSSSTGGASSSSNVIENVAARGSVIRPPPRGPPPPPPSALKNSEDNKRVSL